MKTSVAVCSLTAFLLIMLILGVAPLAAQNPHQISAKKTVNGPTPNPYLASPLYAITHFDSSQGDSTPYGPPRGTFTVDPTTQPIVYAGPVNIVTLASTKHNYMWQVGDRVSYVNKNADRWESVASYQALADASENSNNYFPPIPVANFRAFGESSAVGMNPTEMDGYLQGLFGANYDARFASGGAPGAYSLVDKDNVLYSSYVGTLYGFALINPARPSDGITVRHKLEHVVTAIEGNNPPPGTILYGLSMTYDGRIVITLSNGVAVIDRNLDVASISFYRFSDSEYVTNSIAVDEDNGIYVATGWSFMQNTTPISVMRKLVWTGTSISDKESDGAWSTPYDNSGTDWPPIIKAGDGTGSTPALMGFGDDPDKLVVITDGAKQMKLVAFWRNQIPDGFTERIAGQIPVTCGFNPLPDWIQSEQSVAVHGYGAFVVNNIPETVSQDIQIATRLAQVSLMGPAYPTSLGAERFQWDPSTHTWSSVWARSDVSSTSMVPIHSQSANMALISGWYGLPNGWEVLGLDWDTGQTVHRTIFGQVNFGNGAYAILEYLENQDLLYNSIVGPFRVHYGPGRKPTWEK